MAPGRAVPSMRLCERSLRWQGVLWCERHSLRHVMCGQQQGAGPLHTRHPHIRGLLTEARVTVRCMMHGIRPFLMVCMMRTGTYTLLSFCRVL